MTIGKYLIAASLLAVAGSASATTVNFTDEESPGVTNRGPVARTPTRRSASRSTTPTGIRRTGHLRRRRHLHHERADRDHHLNGGTNGVGFQYWSLRQPRVYEAFDAANVLLDRWSSTPRTRCVGTHSFNGLVDRLTFSGSTGFVQVSAVTFEGDRCPSRRSTR